MSLPSELDRPEALSYIPPSDKYLPVGPLVPAVMKDQGCDWLDDIDIYPETGERVIIRPWDNYYESS